MAKRPYKEQILELKYEALLHNYLVFQQMPEKKEKKREKKKDKIFQAF